MAACCLVRPVWEFRLIMKRRGSVVGHVSYLQGDWGGDLRYELGYGCFQELEVAGQDGESVALMF